MQIKDLPVYVISLPHAVERQKKIKAELDKVQINFEFIAATDDRQPLSDADLAFIGGAARLPLYAAQLNQGALGCLLSHLRCYEKLLQSDNECMLLLEDDAELSPQFVEILGHALAHRRLWNLLQLGYLWEGCLQMTGLKDASTGQRTLVETDAGFLPWFGKQGFPISLRARKLITSQATQQPSQQKFYLGPPAVNINGTYGYLINRQGCSFVLERHQLFTQAIDDLLNSIKISKRAVLAPRLVHSSITGAYIISNAFVRGQASYKAASQVDTLEDNDEQLPNITVLRQSWSRVLITRFLPMGSPLRAILVRLLRRTQVTINMLTRTSAPGHK